MHDDVPRYFTAIDLFWELVHLGFIAAGCYVGWKVGGHFLALFAGAVVGRIVGVSFWLGIRSCLVRKHD